MKNMPKFQYGTQALHSSDEADFTDLYAPDLLFHTKELYLADVVTYPMGHRRPLVNICLFSEHNINNLEINKHF